MGWSTALLAEKIRVQPSYLTNVIKERAHFSADQIHAIAFELGLSDDETQYLDLLMQWERAEFKSRKKSLHEQVQELRHKHIHADQQLLAPETALSDADKERYYLDPNIELIHLYLGVKGVPSEIGEIAQAWGLRSEYVVNIIAFLEKRGLIERVKKTWKVKPVHQMLSHESPLCKPQQILKRLRALDVLQRMQPERVYSFNGTLTMSEETRMQVQARFIEFLKECEELVLASPSEGIYNLQFDLFPWL